MGATRSWAEVGVAWFITHKVGVAVGCMADCDMFTLIPTWLARTERAYPKLIYYNQVDKGGHFAAWEQPELFVAELRSAFRSVRPVH